MARYEFIHDRLNYKLHCAKDLQKQIVVDALKDNGRAIGGCIGYIDGIHGHCCLESIYLNNDPCDEEDLEIKCHLNYPAFEADADFDFLSIDERQQIVELLIKEAQI